MAFQEELKQKTKQVDDILKDYLPEPKGPAFTVLKAMNTTVMAGGKRIRPIFMMETFRMFGGSGHQVDPFLAAMEMIHTYSLIHDDLPALDNDDYRRGQKTCHIVYGENMAILAGDALLNYAFETAVKAFDVEGADSSDCIKALKVLASKPGIYGMIGGQTADVELEGSSMTMDEILYIHNNKTAALIEASMMIGALLAGRDSQVVKDMEICGNQIGLAFQIQDDILDITGSEDVLGKPVGSDEKNHKQTYVTVKGMDQSKKDVQTFSENALAILDHYDQTDCFLKELVRYLVHREK